MEGKSPRFSIVTVCYNAGKTLERTILSMRSQTCQNFEHIIIDGGSTDNTLEILEKYKAHIKYISEPDDGIYEAMNKGVRLANGDYIAILNADDWYVENALEMYDEAIDRVNGDVDYLYGQIIFICKDLKLLIKPVMHNDPKFAKRGLQEMLIPHISLFVKSSVWRAVGEFNVRYRIVSDHDFLVRLSKHTGNAIYLDKVVGYADTGGVTSRSNTIAEHAKIAIAHGKPVCSAKALLATLWLRRKVRLLLPFIYYFYKRMPRRGRVSKIK